MGGSLLFYVINTCNGTSVYSYVKELPKPVHVQYKVSVCPVAYQVLVGEPGDLVLQTGFDPGLRRQLQVLG